MSEPLLAEDRQSGAVGREAECAEGTTSTLNSRNAQQRQADAPIVTLLTGGFDQPYAYGLSMALVKQGLKVHVIGSDRVDSPEMHTTVGLTFLNLIPGWRSELGPAWKIAKIIAFYLRLLAYSLTSNSRVFHTLWNNRAVLFDRTFLMLFYKVCGKRIVLTAHNINAGQRDGSDSLINRLTLRFQYRFVDHIFVHTQKMREELVRELGVRSESVTVIPFGINNAVPHTALTGAEARRRLGIGEHEKAILFFGNIRTYKGLQHLVNAFDLLVKEGDAAYRLIIAGSVPNDEGKRCWAEIQHKIRERGLASLVTQRIEYIPDRETEVFFKAADVAALPYLYISHSGVLSLAYSFGLPVIATNVGSFEEEIREGETGYTCKVNDPDDLARAIRAYFAGSVYSCLEHRRREIQKYAERRYSWEIVGAMTRGVYLKLITRVRP